MREIFAAQSSFDDRPTPMGEIETAGGGEIEEEEQRAQSLDDDLKAIRNLAGCLMMRSSTQGFSLLRARERS